EAARAQLHQVLEIGLAVGQSPREIAVRRRDEDVEDDHASARSRPASRRHGVTQPPANGMTWPTKKSASSEARYTASRADSSPRARRPAGMFRTMRDSFCGSAVSAGGKYVGFST